MVERRSNLHVHYTASLYDRYSAGFLRHFDALIMSRLYAERRKRGLDGALLDLGTGTAQLLLRIAERPAFADLCMYGIDYFPDMVEIASRNIRGAALHDRIRVLVADVHELPWPSGAFPYALSRSTIHHWAEPARALREIDRVLSPGGCAIIHDVRRDPPEAALLDFDARRRAAGVEPSRLQEKYTPEEVRGFAEQAGLAGRFQLFTPTAGAAALGMELFFWK